MTVINKGMFLKSKMKTNLSNFLRRPSNLSISWNLDVPMNHHHNDIRVGYFCCDTRIASIKRLGWHVLSALLLLKLFPEDLWDNIVEIYSSASVTTSPKWIDLIFPFLGSYVCFPFIFIRNERRRNKKQIPRYVLNDIINLYFPFPGSYLRRYRL